jgi:PPM family protein phosphatase
MQRRLSIRHLRLRPDPGFARVAASVSAEVTPVELLTSIVVHAGNPELQDRAEIIRLGTRTLFAVADGAGGISGGAEAADLFMRLVRESAHSLRTETRCVELLQRIDDGLCDASDCGQSTGVLTVIDHKVVFGASVGDSMAWAFSAYGKAELTCGQQRKPFLGSGMAVACPFTLPTSETTLVVATDGLWKYTSLELIKQRVHAAEVCSLAEALSELVRLPSGTFPDDVAIVTCKLSR